MQFSEVSTEDLTQLLKDNAGSKILASIIRTELDARETAAKADEARESSRMLAAGMAGMFLAVRKSGDPEISDDEGPAYKGTQRALIALLRQAYGLSAIKAGDTVALLLSGKVTEVSEAVETASRRKNEKTDAPEVAPEVAPAKTEAKQAA